MWGKIPTLLLFSQKPCPTLCNSHGLQHARLPCPSLAPWVCSNSSPLSEWCHPTTSPSVTPFSSCPRFFPAFSSVQSLSHVLLFATPWTAAHQASLSITNSQSLLKLMPIESVMPSSHLILCHPLLLPPPASDLTFITRYNHNWVSFPLWLSVFISLLFPSSILDTYCSGGFIFQCHFFLPFHHVHGVLKARILKSLAIAFSSGPCFVRPCLAGACPLASQRSWMTCSVPWLSHCWLSLSA